MKRTAIILALCLLFGVIVNITVAWGCILRRPYLGAAPISDPQKGGTWEFPVPQTWPAAPYGHWEERGLGWRMRSNTSEPIDAYVGHLEPRPDFNTYVWRCGWPCYSMKSVIVTQDITGKTEPRQGRHNQLAVGIVIPDAILKLANWDIPCLPTRPEPLGFAANTALYTSLFALPYLFLGPIRRWRRFRSGLCPRCKYPIAASPVCTECGRTLPQTGAT